MTSANRSRLRCIYFRLGSLRHSPCTKSMNAPALTSAAECTFPKAIYGQWFIARANNCGSCSGNGAMKSITPHVHVKNHGRECEQRLCECPRRRRNDGPVGSRNESSL